MVPSAALLLRFPVSVAVAVAVAAVADIDVVAAPAVITRLADLE